MDAPSTPTVLSARPYRSHKFRACDYCRRRKARCAVETLGQPCVLCNSQGLDCRYSKDQPATARRKSQTPIHGPSQPSTPVPRRSLKRPHSSIEPSVAGPEVPRAFSRHVSRPEEPSNNHSAEDNETSGQSAHIVGPAMTSDAHVLEQYMSPNSPEGHQSTQNPYSVYSADPQKPVLYTKVPRRRAGLAVAKEPGTKQVAILDQILAPNARRLLQLYFEKVHPAFPIVDNTKFLALSDDNSASLATALMCEMYAITLSYWNQATFAKNHPRPDSRFAWNLAVKALQDDFLAPGISTLQAVLVDLTGRPTYSITGNVINNGRAVTLSYSLGLNRDPSQWNISRHEKNLRIRLWWGVLIHDRWGSLAHGTPPCINFNHYDVPPPTLGMIISNPEVSRGHEKSSECFIALCKLTEILGRVLPLVYDLKGNSQKDTLKTIRRVETDLDEWEDSLPGYILNSSENEMTVSGSSSLQLGLLSLKMLICRISLHAVAQSDTSSTAETLQYRQFECRRAAQTIVGFVRSLQSTHLEEFWLPYGAYYLTSTTTLLLRFAVETTDDTVAESCVSSVKSLAQRLRHAKENDDWDLADDCLTQCEGIIARMTHNGRPQHHSETISRSPINSFDFEDAPGDWLDATLPAFYGPMDGTGQIRDVWGMFEFPEPSTI